MKRIRTSIGVGWLARGLAVVLTGTGAFAGQISTDLTSQLASATTTASKMPMTSARMSDAAQTPLAAPVPTVVNVMVQYSVTPTTADFQSVSALGGTLIQSMLNLNSAYYSVPVSAINSLAALPNVTYLTPNRALQGNLNITAATVHSNVANQSYNLKGDGIGVAVIDSGIGASPFFGPNQVVYRQSFDPAAKTFDDYGHGTHVAGIIASGGDGTVFNGIAPHVSLIDLRVLDSNGSASDAEVMAAIDTAIQLKKKYNIRVINLSLGRAPKEAAALDPLCQAVEAAWRAGITVVVAAGNEGRLNFGTTEGYGTIGSPGIDPYVITVGAMNAKGTSTRNDDVIGSYSSKGPTAFDHYVKPDLVAPGNKIVSVMSGTPALAKLHPANVAGPGLLTLSGTSMATPVVSGAAALLLQKNSLLTLIRSRRS